MSTQRPSIKLPVFGLTGGIASGKTKIAKLFMKLGVDVVDADEVSHEITAPGTAGAKSMLGLFGEEFALEDGSPNRRAVREHVFKHPTERKKLEDVLHPIIYEEIMRRLHKTQGKCVLLVSPILLETRQKDLCDKIIVINVQKETQIQRAMQRDGADREAISYIMEAQIPTEEKLKRADFVLNNEGDCKTLEKDVQALYSEIITHIENMKTSPK